MRKLGFSSIDQSPNTSNFEWSNSISDISKNEISFIIGSKLNSSKSESKLINRNVPKNNKNNITILNISGSNYGIHKAKKSNYLNTISKPKKPTFKSKRKAITIKKSNDTLLLERRLRSRDKIEKSEIKTNFAEKEKSEIETSNSKEINKIKAGDLFRNSLPIVALQPCTYVSPLVGRKKVFETAGKRKSIVMFSCSENDAAVEEILHPTNDYSKKKSEKLQILPKKKVAKNFYRRVLTKEAFKGNRLNKKQNTAPSLNYIKNQSANVHTQKLSDESSILPNTSEDANSFDSNNVHSSTLSSNLSIREIKTPKSLTAINSNQNIEITDCETKENMYINSENRESHCLANTVSNENLSVNCSLVTDKLLSTNETFSKKSGNIENSIPECNQSYYSFNSKEKNMVEKVSKDKCFTDVISNETPQNENSKTKSCEGNRYNIIKNSSVSDYSLQLSCDTKINENEISSNISTSTNQVENFDQIDNELQTEICTVKYMKDSSQSPIKKLGKPKFSILNLTGNSMKSCPVSLENKTINIPTLYSESKNCDKSNSSIRSELSFQSNHFSNDTGGGNQIALNCSRVDLDHNIDIENFNIVEELSFFSNSSNIKDNGESKISDCAANKSNINFHQKSINQNDSRLSIDNKSENESQFRYNLRTRNNVSNDNTIKNSPVKAQMLVDKEYDKDQTEIIKTKHNIVKTPELSKIPILKKVIYNEESPRKYIVDLDKSSFNQSDKSHNLVSTDKSVINGTQNINDSSQIIKKIFDLHENVYFNENCRQESLNHIKNISSVENSKKDISLLNYDSYKNINDEILQEYNKQDVDVHNAETTFNSSVVSGFSEKNKNVFSRDNKSIFQNENKNAENSISNENSQNNKSRYNLRERLNKTAVQKLDSKQTKSLPNFQLVNYEISREDHQSTIQNHKTANIESSLNQVVNYDLSTSISNIDQSSVKQIKKVKFSTDASVYNSVDNIQINSPDSNGESNNESSLNQVVNYDLSTSISNIDQSSVKQIKKVKFSSDASVYNSVDNISINSNEESNNESSINQVVNYDLSTSISNIDQSSVKQIKKVTFSSDAKVYNSVDSIQINSPDYNGGSNNESSLNQVVNYDLSTSISNVDQSSVKQIKKVTFSSDAKVYNSVDNISINSSEFNEESNNLSIKSVHSLDSLKSSSKLIEKNIEFQNSSNGSQNITQNSNLKSSKNYIDRVFRDISHLLNIKEIDKTKSVNEFLEILVPNYSSYESSMKNYSCQDHTSFAQLESPKLVTTSLQNIFNQNLLNINKENSNFNTIIKSKPTELECQINDKKTYPKYSEIGTQTIRNGKLSKMKTMKKVNRETQCKLSLCTTDESICQMANTEHSLVSTEITKDFNKLHKNQIIFNEIPPVSKSSEREIQQNNCHEKVDKFNITADMEPDTCSYFESTRLMDLPKVHGKPNVIISPIASQKSVIIKSNDENVNEGIIDNSSDDVEETEKESDMDSETSCSVTTCEDSESNNLNNKISQYRKQCDIIEEENEEERSTVIDATSKTTHHTLCIESPVNNTKRKHNIEVILSNQLEDDKEVDLSHFPSPIKCDFKKVRFNSTVDSVDGFSTFIEKNQFDEHLSFVSPNDPIITVEGISFRGDGKRTRARAVSNPYETIVYERENICYRKIDPSPTKIRDRKARLKQHLCKSKSKIGKLDISKYIDSPESGNVIIRNPITNIEEKKKLIFDINEYYNVGFCKTNSLVIRKNVFTKQMVNNQSDSIIQMIPIKQKRSSITVLVDKYKISFRPNQKMIIPKSLPYVIYNPNNQVVNIIQTVSLPPGYDCS